MTTEASSGPRYFEGSDSPVCCFPGTDPDFVHHRGCLQGKSKRVPSPLKLGYQEIPSPETS
jgi:hypothetical protein